MSGDGQTLFSATPTASIPPLVKRLRQSFNAQKTKPLEFRLNQLRKLFWGLQDYEASIIEACKADLGKSAFETLAGEIRWCQNDILFVSKHLADWMKTDDAPYMDDFKILQPRIRKEPYGVVLIIGPFNFPVQLTIAPLIGAIAAGCPAVVKPSESTPRTAVILEKIIADYLEPSCYACVQGAIPETEALLKERWDKIFFTGSPGVGKIIAKKAAETLTPVALELGGRNPAIVTASADPLLAAKRLAFGKVLNAGQVCLSHNYALVDKRIFAPFIEGLKQALKDMYPNGAKSSPDLGRLVNQRSFDRVKKLLETTSGKVLVGGTLESSDFLVEPTILEVENLNDPILANETFAPLMPVYAVNGVDEAIEVANSIDPTPLSLSVFGNDEDVEKVLSSVRSGGATVNDSYLHAGISMMPMGGVGESGIGQYRGKASFDCFTHLRSMVTTPSTIDSPFSAMYPPYEGKAALTAAPTPNFDRDGKLTSDN